MDTTQKGIRTKQRVIKNVVSLLQRQENGFGRCNYRRSLEILRNLVCDVSQLFVTLQLFYPQTLTVSASTEGQ